MSQVEILPQSIVDERTIVLKSRLHNNEIKEIGERIRTKLFGKFKFWIKPENVRLICFEKIFEPFLIIGGKYSLDYCRKHLLEVPINEKTKKVFIAGKEFSTDSKQSKRVVNLLGEEHAHHERETYFILDRMKREIPPDLLPISPFDINKNSFTVDNSYKTLPISLETQIDYLRTKIAERPLDVAEILREVFDITERTIVYYPMYQLTYENTRNQKEVMITINGITGETIVNGTKKIVGNTTIFFSEEKETHSIEAKVCKPQEKICLDSNHADLTNCINNRTEKQTLKPDSSETEETIKLGFPAIIHGEIFVADDNIMAVVGDMEVPSGTTINKTLVVKGTLKIGDNCRALGKLKALRDITIGADTVIEGDLMAGGNVVIGSRSLITGSLKAGGFVKTCKNVTIEQGLSSGKRDKQSETTHLEMDVQNVAI